MREFMKLNTDLEFVIKLFPEIDNKPGAEVKKAKGKDSENPLNALIEYLLEYRSKIGKNAQESAGKDEPNQKTIQQQLELIDTTLLKCYLQVFIKFLRFIFKTIYSNKYLILITTPL